MPKEKSHLSTKATSTKLLCLHQERPRNRVLFFRHWYWSKRYWYPSTGHWYLSTGYRYWPAVDARAGRKFHYNTPRQFLSSVFGKKIKKSDIPKFPRKYLGNNTVIPWEINIYCVLGGVLKNEMCYTIIVRGEVKKLTYKKTWCLA